MLARLERRDRRGTVSRTRRVDMRNTNVLILGRVTTGEGGDIVLAKAREILSREFPDVTISVFVPDEKIRRVGQAVAAAGLPKQ